MQDQPGWSQRSPKECASSNRLNGQNRRSVVIGAVQGPWRFGLAYRVGRPPGSARPSTPPPFRNAVVDVAGRSPVPWFRKSGPPPPPGRAGPENPPAPPSASEPPLSDVRFEIQAVYWITGPGTVLAGLLRAGTIAPGTRLRRWKTRTGSLHADPIEVVTIQRPHPARGVVLGPKADTLARADSGPGPLGLQIRGVPRGTCEKSDLRIR